MRDEPPPTKAAERPLVCPACGSSELRTASKTVDVSTYWHCAKCGEIWNAGRRQDRVRYGYSRR